MFGRFSNENLGYPAFAGENLPQQFDTSAPQVQLLGDSIHGAVPVGGTVDPVNGIGSEHAIASTRPMKRAREPEPISMQQKLHISLHNNFRQDDVGHAGTILNPNPVSTGLRLSYEEDECNSSVTTAGENMKAFHAAVCSISNNVKVELDRQRQLLDHCIRVQEENIMNGTRELNQRHTASLLNALEEQVGNKLQEKQVELENMSLINKELSLKIREVAREAQLRKLHAQNNESLVNVLLTHLQQVIAEGLVQAKEGYGDNEVDSEASYINPTPPENLNASGSVLTCKHCKTNEVSILLLPCRHLCLCNECDLLRQFCPVCQVMKNASVEVFLP